MTTPSELNRRTVLKTVGAGVIGSVALTGNATAQRGRLKKELAEVRSATAEYNDPANAYADGYFALDHDGKPVLLENVVDDAHWVCGMGFHFMNPDLVGSTEPTEPAVLAYGLGDGDDLILGAVEYIVPKGEDSTESPDLFAHDDGTENWEEDSPYPGVWSLHAWVHTPNPDGVFTPANPRKQFHPSGCDGHEH